MNSQKTNLIELSCMVCGKMFNGKEPVMCCSGRDCGCMGLPIDPIVCSDECYNNLPSHKPTQTHTTMTQEQERLIETKANEYYHSDNSYETNDIPHFIDGMKEILSNPTEYGLCRWVKASERLPYTFFTSEEYGDGSLTLNLKLNNVPYCGRYIKECGKTKNVFVVAGVGFYNSSQFNEIEWLEEPTQ